MASLSAVTGNVQAATAGVDGTTDCGLPEGVLGIEDLPTGSSVIDCDAVGRVVIYDGAGVAVPEPGTAVSVDALTTDGEGHGFTLEVAADGKVAYDLSEASADSSIGGSDVPDVLSNPAETAADLSQESDSTDAADAATVGDVEVADADALASPGACNDGAYSTADRKEYGTYEFWIGDGGMPGGLSQAAAISAFIDSVDNVTESYNNCGYSDQVGAKWNYRAATTWEADISTSSTCTERDGVSVWDAGNIKDSHVAVTCSWTWPMPGVKNDLREADVRFNTHDWNFTNNPTSSCANKYDIRSVGTHEAGHIFGLGHVGSGHENLTMYTNSFRCTTKARTLGKGDILGLRSIY